MPSNSPQSGTGRAKPIEPPGGPNSAVATDGSGPVCPDCRQHFAANKKTQVYCSEKCRVHAWERRYPRIGRQKFDGVTFDPAIDGKRLESQQERVMAVMADCQWHTLQEIVNRISRPPYDRASEAGVSARIRDARKPTHGSRTVERRRVAGAGLHEYRLVANAAVKPRR